MSAALRVFLFIADVVLLNCAILFSLYLGDRQLPLNHFSHTYLLVFSNLSWLFLSMVSSPYNVTRGWSVSRIVKSQLAFIFIHLLTVASLVFFLQQRYGLLQMVLFYGLFVPAFFALRMITFYFRKLFIPDLAVRSFVIIGKNALSRETRKYYLVNPDLGLRFKGYLDFDPANFSVATVGAFCSENNVQEIYCCVPNIAERELQQLINFGLDCLIKVKLITSSQALQHPAVRLDRFDHLPGIDNVTIALDDRWNQVIKRVFDLVFSITFTLLVLSWLIPLVALIIRLDSRGPVFFVQQRHGQLNRPFKCLKFRTMVVNQESDTAQATKHDPRITGVGSFLRKSSIDELPQFLNVIIGTMSLIGPRPHPMKLNEKFAQQITNISSRHYVKPGITGLAQCLGYRGETKDLIDMENRVRMDRYYIENWTFWLDIKIVFLTVVSLVRGSDKAF